MRYANQDQPIAELQRLRAALMRTRRACGQAAMAQSAAMLQIELSQRAIGLPFFRPQGDARAPGCDDAGLRSAEVS